MLRLMRMLSALWLLAGVAWSGCVLIYNPVTGLFDCAGGGGSSGGVPNPSANNIVVCTGTNCSTSTTVSIVGGTGVVVANGGGTGGNPTVSADTSVMLSRATDQAGTNRSCRSTTGNDTYVCALAPTLTTYTRNGCLTLDADTANTGTATINVDTLGAKSILNRTGSALADGDITADKPIQICYDGTQFIVQGDGGGGGGAPTPAVGALASIPTCNSGNNGKIYVPTDAFYSQAVCDGTNWRYFVAGAGEAPTLPSWTTVEETGAGSATSTAAGGIALTVDNTGYKYSMRCETISGNTVRSALFLTAQYPNNYTRTGLLGLRSSGDGKTLMITDSISGAIFSEIMNSANFPTTSLSQVVALSAIGTPPNVGTGAGQWRQVEIDATNVTFRYGDGYNWIDVYQVAKATYLGTVDQVCWGSGATSSATAFDKTLTTLLVWK